MWVIATILVRVDSNFGEGVEIEGIVGGQIGAHQQAGALALAQKMPGDDVGVMLHFGDDDFVAFANVGAEAGGDEIDRLRAALGEDDFLNLGGVDEAARQISRAFSKATVDSPDRKCAPRCTLA